MDSDHDKKKKYDEYKLDEYEQEIEDNFESLEDVENAQEEIALLVEAARNHMKRKKSITIRIHENDLEAIK